MSKQKENAPIIKKTKFRRDEHAVCFKLLLIEKIFVCLRVINNS